VIFTNKYQKEETHLKFFLNVSENKKFIGKFYKEIKV